MGPTIRQDISSTLLNFAIMNLVVVLCAEQASDLYNRPDNHLYAVDFIKTALTKLERAYKIICPNPEGQSSSQTEDKRPLQLNGDSAEVSTYPCSSDSPYTVSQLCIQLAAHNQETKARKCQLRVCHPYCPVLSLLLFHCMRTVFSTNRKQLE